MKASLKNVAISSKHNINKPTKDCSMTRIMTMWFKSTDRLLTETGLATSSPTSQQTLRPVQLVSEDVTDRTHEYPLRLITQKRLHAFNTQGAANVIHRSHWEWQHYT